MLHDRFENASSTVHFHKLTVASHRLMYKSKHLWEDINVFAEDEEEDLEAEILEETFGPVHISNSYDAHL